MLVNYRTNNSGGDWWLEDKDWKNLEKAGWHVIWGSVYFCGSSISFLEPPEGKPTPCANSKDCKGHRKYDTAEEADKDRYMGALAVECEKEFDTVKEALVEFEKITKQDVMNEGCNCCGAPHRFTWNGGSCSGEECGRYLYPEQIETLKMSKRELLEKTQPTKAE